MSLKRKSSAELKEEYEKALARAEKLKQQMKKATVAEEAKKKPNSYSLCWSGLKAMMQSVISTVQ